MTTEQLWNISDIVFNDKTFTNIKVLEKRNSFTTWEVFVCPLGFYNSWSTHVIPIKLYYTPINLSYSKKYIKNH